MILLQKGEDLGRSVVEAAAVLYDVDGTLLNSVELYCSVVAETFQALSLDPVDKEQVLDVMRYARPPWETLIPPGLKDRERLIQRAWDKGEEILERRFLDEVRAFPGTLDSLKALKQAGLKIGVVTASLNPLGLELLHREGIMREMDAVVTGHDSGRPKPAPDPILECLQRIGSLPGLALYVGDSPVDIVAGRGAGTMTVGVLSGTSNLSVLLRESPTWVLPDVTHVPLLFTGPGKDMGPWMGRQLTIQGVIYSDLGVAASFTEIPWVKRVLTEKIGFLPFPGTLNVRVEDRSSLSNVAELKDSPGIIIEPEEAGFCTARCYPVLINEAVAGAILVPDVSDYPLEKIEVVAPVHIKRSLGLSDGQPISLTAFLR